MRKRQRRTNLIIATPVVEDLGVRLFIGQQNTLDMVFEAFLEPDLIKAGNGARRLKDMQALETPT